MGKKPQVPCGGCNGRGTWQPGVTCTRCGGSGVDPFADR